MDEDYHSPILGMDIGGLKNTAWAVCENHSIEIHRPENLQNLSNAEYLIEFIQTNKIKIVAMDAPLSVPDEFKKILNDDYPISEIDTRLFQNFLNRPVDLKLRENTRKGMPWFSLAYISLKAIHFKNAILRKYNHVNVIEAYPGTLNRNKIKKKYTREYIRETYKQLQLSIPPDIILPDEQVIKNDHEMDAVITAIIGVCRLYYQDSISQVDDPASGDSIFYFP